MESACAFTASERYGVQGGITQSSPKSTFLPFQTSHSQLTIR